MTKVYDILVDLDGVLADFEAMRYACLLEAGLPALKPCEVHDFYGTKSYKDRFGAKAARNAREIITRPGFFAGMSPVPGALGQVRLLSDYHRVRICSKPLSDHPRCTEEKREWVARNLGQRWAEEAIITSDKSAVKADFLIDDRPDLKSYAASRGEAEPTWKHVLFRQPWNVYSTEHDYVMHGWTDFAWLRSQDS